MGVAGSEGSETLMEYEVIWNGARDAYLCIEPYRPRDLSYVPPLVVSQARYQRTFRTYQDQSRMRQQIRTALRRRGTMTVKALRKAIGAKDVQFYNVLGRMVKHGVLERPEHGIVRLALSRRAEERA